MTGSEKKLIIEREDAEKYSVLSNADDYSSMANEIINPVEEGLSAKSTMNPVSETRTEVPDGFSEQKKPVSYVALKPGRLKIDGKESKESLGKRFYRGTKALGKKAALGFVSTVTLGLLGYGVFLSYDYVQASKEAYNALSEKQSQQTVIMDQQREQINRLEGLVRELAISIPDGFRSSFHGSPSVDGWKPGKDDSTPSYWISSHDSGYLEKGIDGDKQEHVFVVDKKSQTGFLYTIKASLVDVVPVSTGKNPGDKIVKGDTRTPVGNFNIVSVEKSDHWKFEGEFAYGPYFLRLDSGNWDSRGRFIPTARSSIGIHGTNEPGLLGSNKSHGCIRLPSDKINSYVEKGLLQKGTRIVILSDEYSGKPTPSLASAYNSLNVKPVSSKTSLETLVAKQRAGGKNVAALSSDTKANDAYRLSGLEKNASLPVALVPPGNADKSNYTKNNVPKIETKEKDKPMNH